MKKKHIILIFLIIFIHMVLVGAVSAKSEANSNRTLSPYFWVKSDDPELDQLPLKSTSADVIISGVIADVIVTQVYKNEGRRPLEAVYVFPASTRAAVYAMKMTIGERTITAKIRKRQEARQEYEQAKQMGKSASLLEQHRPNVFQMNVANILPQDVIRVELRYTESLVPTDTVYEFVYPTVVGPRYSETPAAQAPSITNCPMPSRYRRCSAPSTARSWYDPTCRNCCQNCCGTWTSRSPIRRSSPRFWWPNSPARMSRSSSPEWVATNSSAATSDT